MNQPSTDARRLRIVEMRHTGPLVDTIYADILRPSFPPDELIPLANLRAAVTAGTAGLTVALDPAGTPLGAAVGEWFAAGRVMLLGYMAARPGIRRQGVGGALLAEAVRAWSTRYQPCLVLAEVERPDRHRASLDHGDPADRLRFYQRHGATALELPYFQPALSAATNRAYGMLLIALHLADDYRPDEAHVTAEPVRQFWADYLAQTEGATEGRDRAVDQITTALHREHTVGLRPLHEYRRIPVAD